MIADLQDQHIDRLGRAIAIHAERLRLPTLCKEDARAMAGRDSDSAFERFCKAHRVRPAARGRYRRRDILQALEREARG